MQYRNYRETEDRLMRAVKAMDPDEADMHSDSDFLRQDRNAPPPTDLGFYIPTGNRILDSILANARPPILYGGNESANVGEMTYRGQPAPHGSLRILHPMPEQFTSEANRLSTLVHELVHWTQEEGRVPRPAIGQSMYERFAHIVPEGYVEEELIAEIGSALLLDAIGADPQYDERAAYALNWTFHLKDPAKAEAAWRRAFPKAEAAVDYLLQFAEV